MAESFAFSRTADRKTIYDEILPQIESLISGESDVIANLANIAAVLREAFRFFWIGFAVRQLGRRSLFPFLIMGPKYLRCLTLIATGSTISTRWMRKDWKISPRSLCVRSDSLEISLISRYAAW